MQSIPTNTSKADGVLDAAQPLGNGYKASVDTAMGAVKEQTAMMGHNVFRPDIYKVSEGTVI